MLAPAFSLPVAWVPLKTCSSTSKQGQSCNWKTKNRGKHAKLKKRGKREIGLQNKGSLAIFPKMISRTDKKISS